MRTFQKSRRGPGRLFIASFDFWSFYDRHLGKRSQLQLRWPPSSF
jgi:hypothetical protein